LAPVNRTRHGKINGIKHLAVIFHEVSGRKNRFKNKDLQKAVKVLGEIEAPRRRAIESFGMANPVSAVGRLRCGNLPEEP
jgi:hypothetical protein